MRDKEIRVRKRVFFFFMGLILVLGVTKSAMAAVGIAWEGFDMTGVQYHEHIHYWDGSTTRQISDYWNQNMYPSLDNGQIAWQGGTYFSWYLYYWDGSTIRQITDQPSSTTFPYAPSLHNGQIAWRGDNGIYFWDGNTITILNDSGAYPAGNPSLHNGQIAWTSVNRVYFWDGSTTRQIYAGAFWQRDASLYNGTIAWSCFDGWGGYEIYYWDGSIIRQITDYYGGSTSTYTNEHPSLYNGQIAWSGDGEIYYWDGSTIRQISDNRATGNSSPSLHNGHIAWAGNDGNDSEIYYWDGSTIRQITDNSLISEGPPSLSFTEDAWPDSDGDGVIDAVEDGAPNSGDANEDGTSDSQQTCVTSLQSVATGNYCTIETGGAGSRSDLINVTAHTEASLGGDPMYDHPYGLVSFQITGLTPGDSEDVRIYFHGVADLSGYTYRNYNPNTGIWSTLPGVAYGTAVIGGQVTAYAEFTLTDGGVGDADDVADGDIEDPSGPGISGGSGSGPARVPVFNGWWLLMGIFPGLFLILRRVRRG